MQLHATILAGADRARGLSEIRRRLTAAGVDAHALDTLWLDGEDVELSEALAALGHVPWQAARRVVVVVGLVLQTGEAAFSDLVAGATAGAGDDLPWLIAWTASIDHRLAAIRPLVASGVLIDLRQTDAESTITALSQELGVTVDRDARHDLAALVSDLAGLESELAKLRDLTDGAEITREAVARATTGDPELSRFALAQAVRERRLGRALDLVRPLLRAGQEAILLNAQIGRELSLIGRVMAAGGDRRRLAELGLAPWILSQLQQAAGRWRQTQILHGVEQVLWADEQLKGTLPKRRDALILEILLVELLAEAG